MANDPELISDQPVLSSTSIATDSARNNVDILVEDRNLIPSVTSRMTAKQLVDVIPQPSTYRTLSKTSHGLVSGDVGKTLSGFAVLDDTSVAAWPSGVLMSIPDANNLTVATPGSDITLSTSWLANGNSTNLTTEGRYFHWDLSASKYVSTRPKDSLVPDVLEVISINTGASTFLARVRSL